MFLRRVIHRHSCLYFNAADGLQNGSPYPFGFKHEDSSAAYHNHTDSTKREVPTKCSNECPIVTCDLQRILTIDNRFDLYQFLRDLVLSERFNDEVKRLVGEHGRELSFPQVLTIVAMYSWNQREEEVAMVQSCAEENYPKELAAQGNFSPQKIICHKTEPTRVLGQLLDLASSRSHLKAIVLAQAELFMNRIISRGSRSVVDRVNEFLVRDCSPDMKGPLLCSSWISFYLSPYDDDQIRADSILKANEHFMQPHLDLTLSAVAQHLLNRRQLNRYYVLLQVFSKRSQMTRTKDLLETLFRHFYETNNLRGCLTCELLARELSLDLSHDIKYKCDLVKKSKSAYRSGLDMKFIF